MQRKINNKKNLVVENLQLMKQWHPTKNKTLTPDDVTLGSSRKIIHWICEEGHEWEESPYLRSTKHFKCPVCKKNKNCLAVNNPKVAKEWHPFKNGDLTPYDVSCQSNKKAWWICDEDHEWQAIMGNRTGTHNHQNCPYCSGKRVCKDNCLVALNRKLSKEWHPSKNGKLTPYDFTPNSHKKVWWVCNKGHEWQASIAHRNNKRKCPYCTNRKICSDNCLATTNPELSKEWHPMRNGKLTSHQVSKGSGKKVTWKCKFCDHEWQASVFSRASGRGCPVCYKITLKNGAICDSYIEAYHYLKYEEEKKNFKHDKKYHKDFGRYRYDFYLIDQNKYVEVTSFDKRSSRYYSYLRIIVKKKNYVKKKLGAEFEFIQFRPDNKLIKYVNSHRKINKVT